MLSDDRRTVYRFDRNFKFAEYKGTNDKPPEEGSIIFFTDKSMTEEGTRTGYTQRNYNSNYLFL